MSDKVHVSHSNSDNKPASINNYWLLKTEDQDYSWQDMIADGITAWSGVRNPQAARYLTQMQINDFCFFYETNHKRKTRQISGIVKVVKNILNGIYDSNDSHVQVELYLQFSNPISLEVIKKAVTMQKYQELKEARFLIQPRLSVSPLTLSQWQMLLSLQSL